MTTQPVRDGHFLVRNLDPKVSLEFVRILVLGFERQWGLCRLGQISEVAPADPIRDAGIARNDITDL